MIKNKPSSKHLPQEASQKTTFTLQGLIGSDARLKQSSATGRPVGTLTDQLINQLKNSVLGILPADGDEKKEEHMYCQ